MCRKSLAIASLMIVILIGMCPQPSAADVVVSQIYGGGGNAGASLKLDFVELFNRGTGAVSVSGWSLQYASATASTWQVTSLAGTLQPGSYYLIQLSGGAGGTVDLPAADAVGVTNMSATAGKLALVSNSVALTTSCPADAAIRDFVGYGTANCFEGIGPALAGSNTAALLRAGSGCADTNDNAADFAVGPPSPRNQASASNPCVPLAPSETPTLSPTRTATLTPSASPSLTATPTAMHTLTSTPSVTETASASPTETAADTPTETASTTSSATETPSETPTITFTSSPSASETATETPTITPSLASTATESPTETHSPAATSTPSVEASPSPSETPSASPTATATSTSLPSATETVTPSATEAELPSATATATASPSNTPTATDSVTPTAIPTSTSTVAPGASVCGNGVHEQGEQCDDGNSVDTDLCPDGCSYRLSGGLIHGPHRLRTVRRDGCQLEWYLAHSNPEREAYGYVDSTQTCTDQDSGCDLDARAGYCRLMVVACLNNTDPALPNCDARGISRAQVVYPRRTRAGGIRAANRDELEQALSHLIDLENPQQGPVVGLPLSPAATDLCSLPFPVSIERHGDGWGATNLIVDTFSGVSRVARRERARLRLLCAP